MIAWYGGECQRALQLTIRATMQRLVASFTGSLRQWWSNILTPIQREYMLSRPDPCAAILETLTTDFFRFGLRKT